MTHLKTTGFFARALIVGAMTAGAAGSAAAAPRHSQHTVRNPITDATTSQRDQMNEGRSASAPMKQSEDLHDGMDVKSICTNCNHW